MYVRSCEPRVASLYQLTVTVLGLTVSDMKLWVYIKTLASDDKNPLPKETKGNLIKLADYVSSRTLEVGKNVECLNQKALDCMIMTNLQISEGLMSKRTAC